MTPDTNGHRQLKTPGFVNAIYISATTQVYQFKFSLRLEFAEANCDRDNVQLPTRIDSGKEISRFTKHSEPSKAIQSRPTQSPSSNLLNYCPAHPSTLHQTSQQDWQTLPDFWTVKWLVLLQQRQRTLQVTRSDQAETGIHMDIFED